MTSNLLDPWNSAAEIAKRLSMPNSHLVVILGALRWCQKCRDLYPEFEALASQQSASHLTMLWLDLEDHAEFIGDFTPDDLPLLLVYHGALLRMMRYIPAQTTIEAMMASLQRTDQVPASSDPGIRQRLLQTDWASS